MTDQDWLELIAAVALFGLGLSQALVVVTILVARHGRGRTTPAGTVGTDGHRPVA